MQQKQLQQCLQQLKTDYQDIEATTIISDTGLPLASVLPMDIDADRASAVSAAIVYCGKHTAYSTAMGQLEHVLLQTQSGHVLLTPAAPNTIVTVIFKRHVPLVQIMAQSDAIASKITA